MQSTNGLEIFFIFIIVWSIIAVVTLAAGPKVVSRLEVYNTDTEAGGTAIALGLVLFIGALVTTVLWFVFALTIMPMPDMITDIIFHSGSALVILISIVYIFYPIRKRALAARAASEMLEGNA